MQHAYSPLLHRAQKDFTRTFAVPSEAFHAEDLILCGWKPLRAQLLMQWSRLTLKELDEAGPNRRRIAALVQRRYDIEAPLVENYLHNFERTLPMA